VADLRDPELGFFCLLGCLRGDLTSGQIRGYFLVVCF
jgi:hypothetical protein